MTGLQVTYPSVSKAYVDALLSQGFAVELVQDIIGAMVSGNTETGISVTYDDTTGKLNFVGGGASAASYLTVAAANSTAAQKAVAGLICAGTAGNATDDSAAIEAVADGRPLLFLPGDYYFTTSLDLTLFNNQAYGVVRGKALIHLRDALDIGFTCQGTTTSAQATLNATANKGAKTITVVSTTNFSAGKIFNIRSTDPISDSSADSPSAHTYTSYRGEWVEIESVTNSTTAVLKRPLSDTYTLSPTAPTFRLMVPVTDVRVEGIEFYGTGQAPTATNQKAIEVRHFAGVKITDCGFYDLRNYGAYIRSGIDAEVSRCYGKRIASQGEAGAMAGFFGVLNGRFIDNGGGEDCRHHVDFDGFDPEPPSRGGLIVGNVCTDCYTAAFATHPGVVGLTYVGNVAVRGGGGFIWRGQGGVLTGNVALGPFNSTAIGGYQSGFTIGDGNDVNRHGIAGTDLVFTNNVFLGNRLSGDSTVVSAMRVHDDLIGATIAGNNFKGANEHALDIRCNRVWDTIIEHNFFDCASSNSGKDCINITPGGPASGNYQRDLKIRWNVVTTAPSGVFVRIAGPSSGTNSNQVKVHDNDIPAGSTVTALTGNFDTTLFKRRNLGEVVEDPRNGPDPRDYGMVAWNGDPQGFSTAQLMTTGNMHTNQIWVPPSSITGVAVILVTNGATLTAGQSKCALFSGPAAGAALFGTTVDMSTDLANAALNLTIVKGLFAAAIDWNTAGDMRAEAWSVHAGTAPSLGRATSNAIANSGRTSGQPRYATDSSSGNRTTTAQATMGTLTASNNSIWFGIVGTRY